MTAWADILDDEILAMLVESGEAAAVAAAAAPAEVGPFYPATGGEVTSRTGLTGSHLYTFQEASGNLDDKIGTLDLVVSASAPTFQYDMPGGRKGVHYQATGRSHLATMPTLGKTSRIVSAVCALPTNPGSSSTNIVGFWPTNGTLADGCGIRIANAGNVPELRARDGGSTANVNVSFTLDIRTGTPLFIASFQIDWSANLVRGRITRADGTAEQVQTGSIAAFASVDDSTGTNLQGFAGAIPGNQYGEAMSWLLDVQGVQCEGAGALAALHAALGWE